MNCLRFLNRPWVPVLCVAVVLGTTGSCSWVKGGGSSSSPSVPTAAVVSSMAPTGEDEFSCPGIPDDAVVAMFGQDVTFASDWSSAGFEDGECVVHIPGRSSFVFVSSFGYLGGGYDPWDGPRAVTGGERSRFSFDGVEGEGEALIGVDPERRSGTTVYTCGNNFLLLTVMGSYEIRGSVRENLVNLTESVLPWLCQGEPVPGLGRTLEEMTPPWAVPTASAEPSGA